MKPKIKTPSNIFQEDFESKILNANTPKKAKQLANEILIECDAWRELFYNNGEKDGRKNLQHEIRYILNAKQDDGE